jgi:4-diphosphocytidyl-2-C-methyl-D-erythritol kinase
MGVKVFPCAKINLGLNVVSKRPDGYHNLETIFYPVDIHDELEVEESDVEGCRLIISGVQEICEPSQNLVVKAYNMVCQDYDIPGVKATLTKLLPMQAGMGGGSSDAAYMIRVLNELFDLRMTKDQMCSYASRIGADCAFFIEPTPSYAEGIGDELHPIQLNTLKGKHLVLVKPDVAVSTKEAYAGITPQKPAKNCRKVICQPIDTWREELRNDFEDSVFQRLPVLAGLKQSLYDYGALYAAMSGSGSTIYGIFDEVPSGIIEEYSDIYVKIVYM